MLNIFADSLLTATRMKTWDRRPSWTEEPGRPRRSRPAEERVRQDYRRWLRDTGIL
ncbi:hypothetical protein HKCCE2091_11965 [Rhodobacterales bacterium HKCCE2091]|nr:hypothetical protein [Rhodobacterales bacterium HKCCE2091]